MQVPSLIPRSEKCIRVALPFKKKSKKKEEKNRKEGKKKKNLFQQQNFVPFPCLTLVARVSHYLEATLVPRLTSLALLNLGPAQYRR